MPDRPDDFEPDVLDLLEGMASEATPPATVPPGVLRTARRRLARNSAAVVVALSVLAGGAVAGIRLSDRGDGRPVLPIGSGTPTAPAPSPATTASPIEPSSPTPSATSTPPAGGGGTGPLPAMVFLDGVVYRYAQTDQGPVGEVAGVIPEATAAQPPVATPFGVLVLGGRSGRDTTLWLLPENSPRRMLASNTDGFAVSADGTRVAYATITGRGSSPSELVEVDLQSGSVLHSATFDTFVRAIGYAADEVVLDTGDGASSMVATWQPGSTHFSPVDGFGTAVAADPGSGFAVLHQGDGACWSIVQLGPTGQAGQAGPKQGDTCGLVQASFDPTGEVIAGIELISEDRSGAQRLILAGTASQLGGAFELDGAFQTLWVDRQHILVLEEPAPGRLAVQRCQVSENICPDGPVWTADGAGGDGSAWLVEERPAAG
jgi:hypothetical protein